jgi:hypothetical protein
MAVRVGACDAIRYGGILKNQLALELKNVGNNHRMDKVLHSGVTYFLQLVHDRLERYFIQDEETDYGLR